MFSYEFQFFMTSCENQKYFKAVVTGSDFSRDLQRNNATSSRFRGGGDIKGDRGDRRKF